MGWEHEGQLQAPKRTTTTFLGWSYFPLRAPAFVWLEVKQMGNEKLILPFDESTEEGWVLTGCAWEKQLSMHLIQYTGKLIIWAFDNKSLLNTITSSFFFSAPDFSHQEILSLSVCHGMQKTHLNL